MNDSNSILTQLQTQFRAIDGTAGTYNNNLNDSDVILGFALAADAQAYPSIYISGLMELPSRQADQQFDDVPIEVEVFGYVKQATVTTALAEAAKLASDMRAAVAANETLGSRVHELSVAIDIAAMQDIGVAIMRLRAKYEYTKP